MKNEETWQDVAGYRGRVFTADWFTAKIPLWERYVLPLAGTSCRCLEVGSHEGRSACWVSDYVLTHSDARLTCIDPWPDPAVEARFRRNIETTGRAGQIEMIRARSGSAAGISVLPFDVFDLVYIDGSHHGRHVLEDAVLCWLRLKTGGILIFDDYRFTGNRPKGRRPRDAINLFLSLWGEWLTLSHKGRQVVVQKTG